jgi:hypothetical protein
MGLKFNRRTLMKVDKISKVRNEAKCIVDFAQEMYLESSAL